MKKCCTCGTTDESLFAPSQSRKCRSCTNEYSRANYRQRKSTIIDQSIARNKARVQTNRQLMVEYLKTHPCVDCGESDLVVLEFDHLRDKAWSVSQMVGSSYAWERIEEEINKCEVVCANCHRRRTANRHGGWARTLGG